MMNNLDDKRALYPRVSEIIGKQTAQEMSQISPDVLANAALRGTKIHQYCTAWVNNLWIDEIETEYVPYVDCFKEWANSNLAEIIDSAERLYDDVKRFTGEFDMLVKLKTGEVVLIDIKTSATRSKSWPIQLAAYQHLCNVNGYGMPQVMNLHLKKTKSAQYEEKEGEKVLVSPPKIKIDELRYESIMPYWEIFVSALNCYDYFDRKEVKNAS